MTTTGVKLSTSSKYWKPEEFTDGIREITVYSYKIKRTKLSEIGRL